MPGWWGNPAAAGLRRSEVADTVSRLVDTVVRRNVTTGTSLYLEGPPGIGKSHLIRAAVKAGRSEATVLRAAADQEHRTEAFAVMADLVGGIPSDVNPAEYVLDRIDALCAGGPVVAWVDDAHHADEATLTMLRRVVWSARALPLAVVITARPLPVRERLQLVAAQADVRLRLPPMDALTVERVVLDHLGRWPGPVFSRALAAAAGNPLFVIEMIRSLRAADLLIAGPDGGSVDVADAALPRFVALDRVVRLHVAQLDGAAREALATLAVFGAEVALTELADVMFTQPEDLREPLSRAAAAGLVRLGSDGRVDFAHDVYREVTYDDVPEPLRRLTHARIAELAERRGAGTVRAAQHRLRSNDGTVADDPATLAALREAAASTEQYAPEVAADLLEMAEDVTGGEPDEAVLLRRVEDLYAGGRGAAAERLVRERIGAVSDRAVAAALQAVLIRQLVNRGEVEGVRTVIDRTTSIPGLPITVRTTLAALQGWIALLAGQSVASADIHRMRSDLDGTDADGLPTLALVEACQAFLAGRPADALERFDWINSFRRTVGGGRLDGSAQVFRPWAAMILGGPRAGLGEVQAARRDHERDVRWSDPYLGFVAGAAAMLSAEWDDALAELDTAMELADETGSGWLSLPTGSRCYIDAHRGDTVAARARLTAFRHRGLPIQFGLDFPGIAELAVLEAEGATAAAATLARTLWSAGRARPGRGMIEHSIDIMRVGMMSLQQRLTTQIVDDLTGDLDRAQTKDRRGPEPIVRLRAITMTIKGMRTTDPDLLAASAELFGTQRWEWLRAQTLEELACAAAARKDRARANEAMDAAIAVYERVGARTDRDRLLARTRALGLRRGSRESQRAVTHGWASLTATESRVTTLIRDGLTNREIGARLYISPRTVQTHVAHILTKTALRSRVEVATAAASHLSHTDARVDH